MAQSKTEKTNIGNDLGLKNVLITRFGALGDVAMTVPSIYSVCRIYPDVSFTMLTRSNMCGLFVNAPENLTVVGLDLEQWTGPIKQVRLAKRIREDYNPDALIDLQNDSLTRWLRIYYGLKGVKISRFNHANEHKRALTRRTNKVMLPTISTRARYREAFFNAGLPLEARFYGLYGKDGKGQPRLFRDITGGEKPAAEKWIGIAPFAAYKQKEYPLSKMEEVIEMIGGRGDCRVFIFGGGKREAEIADAWQEKHPFVTSLAGKRHDFSAELALLSHMDVMLTMDSANMHLAAIVCTPTVSIWGATHHYCGFKGWRQSENDMVQVPLSCRPCSVTGNRECYRHDRLCLAAIRPETIYKKIEEKIKD